MVKFKNKPEFLVIASKIEAITQRAINEYLKAKGLKIKQVIKDGRKWAYIYELGQKLPFAGTNFSLNTPQIEIDTWLDIQIKARKN